MKNNKEQNIYTINYTYKNGFRGTQKIVSRCKDTIKLENIIIRQLTRVGRAKFRVIMKKLGSEKIVNGWLLSIDLRDFSIS